MHSRHCQYPALLHWAKTGRLNAPLLTGTDLDVRVVLAGGSPLPSTALFFSMFVKLGITKDGHSPTLVDQGHSCRAIQTLFIWSWHWQHDRHREVDHATYGVKNADSWKKKESTIWNSLKTFQIIFLVKEFKCVLVNWIIDEAISVNSFPREFFSNYRCCRNLVNDWFYFGFLINLEQKF